MVAGRDTVGLTKCPEGRFPRLMQPLQTAALITFTVYMLSVHPHVYDRLRQEIITTIGVANRPTSENLRNMKYLRAVLNGRNRLACRGEGLISIRIPETLRLFPPVCVGSLRILDFS